MFCIQKTKGSTIWFSSPTAYPIVLAQGGRAAEASARSDELCLLRQDLRHRDVRALGPLLPPLPHWLHEGGSSLATRKSSFFQFYLV